jgi:hypothetical protein
MTARFLDVSIEQYIADPCEQPSLSVSIAAELINKSPLHAWQIHPRLGGLRRVATEAMTDGTLIHALLLGKGENRIAVLDVENFKTKAAQAARADAIVAGKAVVKVADYEAAKEVAKALKERMAKLGIVLDGLSEQVIEWHEPTEDEGDVLCRAMLDHLVVRFSNVTEATVFDVKTIRCGNQRTIQRHILDYCYDVQDAAYRSAVGAVSTESRGRVDFVFLFCEIEQPPYEVTPVRLNGMWRALGENKWRHACRTWARCLANKRWPGYADQIITVEPPPWALTEGA